MPILYIQLLGGCQLVYADKPLTTVNSPRLRSLLTYLLLHAGMPQPRQQVAFSLWPDSREAQARNRLRNLLHQLRHALPADEVFIQADDEMVVWCTEANYTLDVAAFERFIAQATSQDETAAQRALEEAVALYQGDLFLGCYDEWIVPVRERLRLAYARALERLIALYAAHNEYTLALHTAERLRQHDPLQETVYAHLIGLAVACGDYARAHLVYEEAAVLLQRELGVEPGPELRRLYATATQPPPAASDPGTPSVLAPNPEALVGRTGEMAQMQRLWRTLQPGHPQVILLSGEPGIGKSRLAQEMMQWVAQQHYPTLRAHCYAGEGGFAYAPVVEWLRTPVVTKAISKLDTLWQRELLRLLPKLRHQYPQVPNPTPLTETWQRRHLCEALAHALLALPQPLLLFLDDWQWCDWETLEWLNFLLRFATHSALLVLGTMRREEVNQRVQTLLLGWQRLGWLTEITLGSLNETEIITLANQVAGYRLDPVSARALVSETEGNPLFVVESIRAHPETGATENAFTGSLASSTHAPGWKSELPAKVQAVIEYRLAQLSDLALALVGVAAVIGRRFSYDLLVAASGQPEDEVVQRLDELCQRRIAQEVEGSVYDFSHDKVREVAYAQLSATRRQFLHRRVGQTLTGLATEDQTAISTQAAFHFEQANSLDQAVRYYLQAAAAAADLHAYHRAAQLYARAAQVAGKLNLPSATLIQIYTGQGRMLEHTGEFVAATQVYHQLEALAHRRADKVMEATAVAQLASAYSEPTSAHDFHQAQALFTRGRALAQELRDIT